MGNLSISPLNAALYVAIGITLVAMFSTVRDWKELSPSARTLILWGMVLVVLVFVFVLSRAHWI